MIYHGGVGCNGIIYILLEKVNYIYQEYLRKVREYTEKRATCLDDKRFIKIEDSFF